MAGGRKILILLLALVFAGTSTACHLYVDGKPLTTEEVNRQLAERYGVGNYQLKQLDRNHWQVALPQYAGLQYTVTSVIHRGGVVPVPQHSQEENRMEALGRLLAPRYFTADEMKEISYASGFGGGGMTVEVLSDFSDEAKISDLQKRVEALCRDMKENYAPLAKDAHVTLTVKSDAAATGQEHGVESPKLIRWTSDRGNGRLIASYLDSLYGTGNYSYEETEDFGSGKEIYLVRLKRAPEQEFHLYVQSDWFGFRKTIWDTRYRDICDLIDYNTFPLGIERAHISPDFNRRGCRVSVSNLAYGRERVPDIINLHREASEYIQKYAAIIYADQTDGGSKQVPIFSTSISLDL